MFSSLLRRAIYLSVVTIFLPMVGPLNVEGCLNGGIGNSAVVPSRDGAQGEQLYAVHQVTSMTNISGYVVPALFHVRPPDLPESLPRTRLRA
jgi:hypothetical protein